MADGTVIRSIIPTSRCSICPDKYRCVLGDGPIPCDYFFLGEAPGKQEDKGGRPFIGDAGLEFNDNYLLLLGLTRDEIYISNAVKCRPDLNRKPGEREVEGCSNHFLPSELQAVQPKVVFLMGATACAIAKAMGMEVNLEVDHGIPQWGKLWDWNGWIVPLYHPAAGLHNTTMMIPLLEDCERLRPWLETGEWQWVEDPFDFRDYRLARTPDAVLEYFWDYQTGLPFIGGDSEWHVKTPFSLQISLEPGTGLMVLEEDHAAIAKLAQCLDRRLSGTSTSNPVEMALHNCPADIEPFMRHLRRQGMRWLPYRDTMIETYNLGNFLRQGLKVMSRRVLGRKRKDWEEVVGKASKDALISWIWQAAEIAEAECAIQTERVSEKTGKPIKPLISPSPMISAFSRIVKHTLLNPEYETWEKLTDAQVEDRAAMDMFHLVGRVGPIPLKGIANCKLEDAVNYGCSDADDTLCLALELEHMRKAAIQRWNVTLEDRDK